MKTIAIVVWILCAFFNWGATLGEFTHENPAAQHIGVAAFMAIGGPFGVPGILCGTNFHPLRHWRFRPLSTEERWQHFNHENGTLGRDYFEQHYN